MNSPGPKTSSPVLRSLLNVILWILTRTFYRLRILGDEHVPAQGGALLVCNHLSQVDALLLLASLHRPVRFMLLKSHYELPWIKPFARMLGVIPISSEQRPRDMLKSLQAASDAIKNGEVVCIFAEGQITRIGQMMPFRRGFERIMKDVEAPIIPVALDGVWGSIFSFQKGRFLWKLPRQIPYPVTVNFGKPMPHTATPFEVRQAVQELMVEAWRERKPRMRLLHREFVRSARRHPFRFAMADGSTNRVNFGAALVKTNFLARRLRKLASLNGLNKLNELDRDHQLSESENPKGIPPQSPGLRGTSCPGTEVSEIHNPERVASDSRRSSVHAKEEHRQMVGLLLPPSVGGALTNFALMLMGKVPVNLNYTVSEETLNSCIRQCRIKTVISSKAFLEKVKLKIPVETVFLEDLSAKPRFGERIGAFLGTLLPVGFLERSLGRGKRSVELDDLATVIFSSGSTGDPKGVMLSHYNIGSNIAQLEQVFGLTPKDQVLGVLPFFHSFGFTGTLFLPAVVGVGAIYHSNPLDAKTIGPMVKDYRITFLLATPTFLQLYTRGCAAEDFGSLRLVMTGAEKLPERLAMAFEEKFGIRPLEGYGCTECGPAVAVNTDDFRSAGFRQVGGKRGKIGHPLPGVSVHIVDPQSNAPVQTGQPGLMLVSGPNIMQGYLGQPDRRRNGSAHQSGRNAARVGWCDRANFCCDRCARREKRRTPCCSSQDRRRTITGLPRKVSTIRSAKPVETA